MVYIFLEKSKIFFQTSPGAESDPARTDYWSKRLAGNQMGRSFNMLPYNFFKNSTFQFLRFFFEHHILCVLRSPNID